MERIAPELGERIPLTQLNFLRGNARRGDHAFLRESLTAFGQTENLVVNRGTHTGVPNELVAGNNRAQVMLDLGWSQCAVSWVDVPDRTTLNKLAVALNRASEKASWDDHALADVLAQIASESDLVGTGFDDSEYADLMRATDTYGDAAAGLIGGLLGGDDDLDSIIDPPTAAPPAPAPAPAQAPTPAGTPAPAAAPPAAATPAPAAAPTPEPAPPITPNVSNGYVTMSWTVLPEQRDIVREALRISQSTYQLETSPEALVAICDRFVKDHT